LPRGYTGLKYKFSKNKNKRLLTKRINDQVFLFDSLPNYPPREIPLELKKALKNGMQIRHVIEGQTRTDITPSTVESDCLITNNTYKRQQCCQDNTCGLWAIYNALMTVMDGTDNFWHELFHKDTSEEESKFEAGRYLRNIIKELSLQQSIIMDTFWQKEEEDELLKELNTPTNTEQDPNQEVDENKYKNKRKYSQTNQTNLDFMIMNSQKTPKRSPEKTPSKKSAIKKRMKGNNYTKNMKNQPAQEKVLINLHKLEEEQTTLHEKINELQQYITDLIQENEEKDKNLHSMFYENDMLRDTIERQRIKLQEYNNEALRELENSAQTQLKIQELEEIIQHQNEQAQTRLKQLQDLQEENDQLLTITNSQKWESTGMMNSMLDSLERMRDKQTPKLDEIERMFSTKGTRNKNMDLNKPNIETPHIQEGKLIHNTSEAMEIERRQSDSPVESPIESKKKVKITVKKMKPSLKGLTPKPQLSQLEGTEGKSPSQIEGQSFVIPWRGRILTPTPSQLRKYAGNLDNIAKSVGSREPEGKETYYREIRLRWKNRTLTPNPRQLLSTGGDLNKLSSLLGSQIRRNRSSGDFPRRYQTTEVKKYFPKGSKDNSVERNRGSNNQDKQGTGAKDYYSKSSHSPD